MDITAQHLYGRLRECEHEVFRLQTEVRSLKNELKLIREEFTKIGQVLNYSRRTDNGYNFAGNIIYRNGV